MSLTPENTMNEFFEMFDPGENAVQVVPMTIKQQDDDTRLAIFIRGKHQDASIIMAALMITIEELHDRQAQSEAQDGESRIVTT